MNNSLSMRFEACFERLAVVAAKQPDVSRCTLSLLLPSPLNGIQQSDWRVSLSVVMNAACRQMGNRENGLRNLLDSIGHIVENGAGVAPFSMLIHPTVCGVSLLRLRCLCPDDR